MIDHGLLDDAPAVPASERCKYPSKFCRNRRSCKRNGDLHRFCDLHRSKANLNQKRWSESRQRPRGHADARRHSPPRTAVDEQPTFPEDDGDAYGSASFTSMLLMAPPLAATGKDAMLAVDDAFMGEFLKDLLFTPGEMVVETRGGDWVSSAVSTEFGFDTTIIEL